MLPIVFNRFNQALSWLKKLINQTNQKRFSPNRTRKNSTNQTNQKRLIPMEHGLSVRLCVSCSILFIAQSFYIDVLILQYISPYTLCIRTHYTILYLLFHAVFVRRVGPSLIDRCFVDYVRSPLCACVRGWPVLPMNPYKPCSLPFSIAFVFIFTSNSSDLEKNCDSARSRLTDQGNYILLLICSG